MTARATLIRAAIGERWSATMVGERIVAARIIQKDQRLTGDRCGAEVVSITGAMVRVRLAGSAELAVLADADGRWAAGRRLEVVVVRSGWFDGAQEKLPVVRPADDADEAAPTAEIGAQAIDRVDQWPSEAWAEVLAVAAGEPYPVGGGSLVVRATPAMTVVDVDGTAPPADLALAAARAMGPLIQLLDLQGAVIVDFPTLSDRAARQAVDAALDGSLTAAGVERARKTAVNGFGLAQLILPRRGASLVEVVQHRPVGHAVRRLLFAGERAAGQGIGNTLELRAPPAVIDAVPAGALEALARRTGRRVVTAAAGSHRLDDLAASLISA